MSNEYYIQGKIPLCSFFSNNKETHIYTIYYIIPASRLPHANITGVGMEWEQIHFP